MKPVDVVIGIENIAECEQWAEAIQKELKAIAPALTVKQCQFANVKQLGYTTETFALFLGGDEARAVQFKACVLKHDGGNEADAKFLGIVQDSLKSETESRDLVPEPLNGLSPKAGKCVQFRDEILMVNDISEDVYVWWSAVLMTLFRKDPYTLSSVCSRKIKICNLANDSKSAAVTEQHLMSIFHRQIHCICTKEALNVNVFVLILTSPNQNLTDDMKDELVRVRVNHGHVYALYADIDAPSSSHSPYFTRQYGRSQMMTFLAHALTDMNMIQTSKSTKPSTKKMRHPNFRFLLKGTDLHWELKSPSSDQCKAVVKIDEMRERHGWTNVASVGCCQSSCPMSCSCQSSCVVSRADLVSLKVTSVSHDNVSVTYKVLRGKVPPRETDIKRRKETASYFLFLILCIGIISPALWLCLLTPVPWMLLHSYIHRGSKQSLKYAKVYFVILSNCLYVAAIALGTILTGNLYVLISATALIMSALISLFIYR